MGYVDRLSEELCQLHKRLSCGGCAYFVPGKGWFILDTVTLYLHVIGESNDSNYHV